MAIEGEVYKPTDAVLNSGVVVNSFRSPDNTPTQEEPDAMGDAILVAAAKSGDSSAFVELSQRHSRRVLSKIYRITNNWQDAEDVFQESLIKAFLHLDTFECKASFGTWLTRIAINTAFVLLRKERRFQRSTIDIASDDNAQFERREFRDDRGNPEDDYARQQRADMLRGAIRRLPPKSRKAIELQQTGKLSTKEIAQSLGISESAVKVRLLRARTMLREVMRNETRRGIITPVPVSLTASGRGFNIAGSEMEYQQQEAAAHLST